MSVTGEAAQHFYLTFDFANWYGGPSLLVLLVYTTAAVIAFHYALGGRKLISDRILDE